MLIREGDAAEYFYVIKDGAASVSKQLDGTESVVAYLVRGDCFGEDALLSNSTRNATVKMMQDSRLMRLSKRAFEEVLKPPVVEWLTPGQASLLATACMQDRLAGVFTVQDTALREYLALAGKLLGEKLEPSATAGFAGPGWLADSTIGREWCAAHKVDPAKATHVLWSTGGGLVPEPVYQRWLAE